MEKDFELFKKGCSWFNHSNDPIEFSTPEIRYSNDFIQTFPVLHLLVSSARTLDLTLNAKKEVINYRLFSWTNNAGQNSGWLCRFDPGMPGFNILPEHLLLINHIGGIEESYSEVDKDEELLTLNMDSIFIGSNCYQDMRYADYYKEVTAEEGATALHTADFIGFATEVNGNETFYDLNTKAVYLYATDHCFDNIQVVGGQPEYTFYTINGVNDFIDYVEMLASQWISYNSIKL
ncbi:hypothetical protein [Pedobacter metabolipauper]|uniref:Uncharacterized protein n=1 Tax=Pedobacter metabolipauper TaxID=425513 RepID=A0A4R6T077_9SPHI|nr:hypothetical protein [Pedobacter metabolipauper]TDQ11419.1 hypothetical protein ATK78_0541 [Pedobacter metabolipauper]